MLHAQFGPDGIVEPLLGLPGKSEPCAESVCRLRREIGCSTDGGKKCPPFGMKVSAFRASSGAIPVGRKPLTPASDARAISPGSSRSDMTTTGTPMAGSTNCRSGTSCPARTTDTSPIVTNESTRSSAAPEGRIPDRNSSLDFHKFTEREIRSDFCALIVLFSRSGKSLWTRGQLRCYFPDREIFMAKQVRSPADIGALVRSARREQNLRQDELAGVAGVGLRFIVDLEAGKPTAQLGKVLQVLQTLGCTIEILAPGERRQ